MSAYLHRIATVAPQQDIHQAFIDFASYMLRDERTRALFLRMAKRSGIAHRWSVLGSDEAAATSTAAFYGHAFPSTAERMRTFERAAPLLARRALDKLALSGEERARIGHIVVTCCTGLYAPGLDMEVIEYLGLPGCTERTVVGFMGCYAAINGLRLARHFVRSSPSQTVLMLNLELCSLHMQETQDLGEVLSFLLFADGAAASLISAEPVGIEMTGFEAIPIPNTRDLITWNIGDSGFDMVLSGRVPGEISQRLRGLEAMLPTQDREHLWAVHPGGRSILDAVQEGLALPEAALATSRDVLEQYGNMSSATVMFVLEEIMRGAKRGQRGTAMSFGPGMVAETMQFHAV